MKNIFSKSLKNLILEVSLLAGCNFRPLGFPRSHSFMGGLQGAEEVQTYSIKKELLIEEEAEILVNLGVELEPSGLTFSRELSESDTKTVGRIIFDLVDRTNDEDNHVGFAVGDYAIKADEWFGEGFSDKWYKDYLLLKALRDKLLSLTGATIVALQDFESLVKTCCKVLTVSGIEVEADAILSVGLFQNQKPTLGMLKRALVDAHLFDPAFEERLGALVDKRNSLVHDYWHTSLASEAALPSLSKMLEMHEFIIGLMMEARALRAPFKGLLYKAWQSMSVPDGANQESHEQVFLDWKKYADEFEAVARRKKDE